MADRQLRGSALTKPVLRQKLQYEAVKILPGEYYVTGRDMVLVTVLGSCVAACIRDRMSGIGGMNHFMLPGNENDNSPTGTSARYGTYAMELMINQLLKSGRQAQQSGSQGIRRRQCAARFHRGERRAAQRGIRHRLSAD